MYFTQDLRVQLQQRRNRLYKATYHSYHQELKYLFGFLNRSPYFRAIIAELVAATPDISFESWHQDHFGWQHVEFPDNETEKAEVCYELLLTCVEGKKVDPLSYAHEVSTERGFDASLRDFTEIFVDPFLNYLHDRIDEGGSVLYILEKYKHKVEWFQRGMLFGQYLSDTKHGEQHLDAHLREYLLDQGIDYPFSSPVSPSGRADVLADLETSEPLVLEIKLFDPEKGYDRAYIRGGFRQVYDYSNDYNKSVGYLVVFNLSPYNLVFTLKAEQKRWPPRLEIDHKTFFLVVVDVFVHEEPASKRRGLKPYEITREFLTMDTTSA